MLYFLTFIAASLRAIYFASPKLESSLAASLMSAYYPVLLSGSEINTEVFGIKHSQDGNQFLWPFINPGFYPQAKHLD